MFKFLMFLVMVQPYKLNSDSCFQTLIDERGNSLSRCHEISLQHHVKGITDGLGGTMKTFAWRQVITGKVTISDAKTI